MLSQRQDDCPGYKYYQYSRYKLKYNISLIENIKKIVDDLDIKFINIHKDVFIKEKNPLSLFAKQENSHYNKEGYNKIANRILEILNEQN